MHYVLNFLDADRHEIHHVHMQCVDDRRAIALVELISLNHEMELRQGRRVVREYTGKILAFAASGPPWL